MTTNMTQHCLLLVILLLSDGMVRAWTHRNALRPSYRPFPAMTRSPSCTECDVRQATTRLFQSTDMSNTDSNSLVYFSEAELETIDGIVGQANDLETAVRSALPNLHPSLVMKLRKVQGHHEHGSVLQVSQVFHRILNQQLEQAKQTLTELLNAGEIRKLDALIGKAARENRLDVAFFNVLTANLQDAMAQEPNVSSDATLPSEQTASRSQILQHVYTRCQEEVEKTIPPGTALLNKLLRTEQASIRNNLYKHYLIESSESQTITTPDGKTLELTPQGPSRALVSLDDFIAALATAVQQIRTIQQAGGIDQARAADMVESCRSVAKEARIVLGNEYGPSAPQVKAFEEGLQPVFRPMSADSPYMKGV